jgi:anti-sigma-K factor RskA
MAEVRADARRTQAARSAERAWTHGLAWPRPALALATACALAVAVVVGVQLGGSTSPATHVYQASVGDAAVHVTGGHGELIVDRLARPAGSNIYEVWLKPPQGKPQATTALFSVTRNGRASVDVPGRLSTGDTVMVTEEPAGGTPAPTTTPVVVAQLS